MAVETIGRAPTATAATQGAGIGQDDFLKILLTQLNYQDPLKPMDNQQFVAQMAQFTALEQTRQANDHLENLLTVQSATQSIGLIGRTVQISTASGTSLGEVTALTFVDGQPQMTVKTASGAFLAGVTLSQISTVR
jgi:flagellar basal-body rod modification protein FlgD